MGPAVGSPLISLNQPVQNQGRCPESTTSRSPRTARIMHNFMSTRMPRIGRQINLPSELTGALLRFFCVSAATVFFVIDLA